MPDVKETTEDVIVEKSAPVSRSAWGLALVLTASALGVVLMALASNAGRNSASSGYTLFWVGLIFIFLPIAFYVFREQTSRNERVLLLAFLGVALYLVKVLEYPLYFTFFDEFLHWRTAQDILATGHLFTPNSLLPVSPFFPGLELVTDSLVKL